MCYVVFFVGGVEIVDIGECGFGIVCKDGFGWGVVNGYNYFVCSNCCWIVFRWVEVDLVVVVCGVGVYGFSVDGDDFG